MRLMTTLDDALSALPAQPSSTMLKNSLLLGFDTETTGVGASDAIVSASLVLRDPAQGFAGDTKADWIINPHRSISSAASAINGFTDSYVAEHGQDPKKALERIASLVALAQNRNIPLLAYNAPFDVGILEHDLHRWHLPGLGARVSRFDLLVVDPLVVDRAISRRPGKRTLSAASAFYHVSPHGDFHDASTDTTAALDLIAPMCQASSTLARLPISHLMDWQRSQHKQWVDHFNEWLARQGHRQISTQWM